MSSQRTTQADPFTTLQQAASERDVSLSTLRRLMRRGVLTRFRRPGRRQTFVLRSQLEKVLQPQAS
jgi:predicted site-specific integrase-resolvase